MFAQGTETPAGYGDVEHQDVPAPNQRHEIGGRATRNPVESTAPLDAQGAVVPADTRPSRAEPLRVAVEGERRAQARHIEQAQVVHVNLMRPTRVQPQIELEPAVVRARGQRQSACIHQHGVAARVARNGDMILVYLTPTEFDHR
jgi:hypothetical protein